MDGEGKTPCDRAQNEEAKAVFVQPPGFVWRNIGMVELATGIQIKNKKHCEQERVYIRGISLASSLKSIL